MQAGEKGLRLGATETENQGFAGFRAPTPELQAGEKGLQLGATETENQGLAGFLAPTPELQAGEKGLRLGATETENQGLTGFRAPTPRRLPGNRFAPLNGGIRLSRVQGANSHRRRGFSRQKVCASRRKNKAFLDMRRKPPPPPAPFPGKRFAPLNGRIRLSRE